MIYSTCVPVAESGVMAMRDAIAYALTVSEYAEARLDYLDDLADIHTLLELLPQEYTRNKIVFTIRTKTDGGRFAGREEDRLKALMGVARHNPFLIDVELDALADNPTFVSYLKDSGASLLVSWHDLDRTPDSSVLTGLLEQMSAYSDRLKIACAAKSVDDAIRMLELYRWLADHNMQETHSLISFAMGDMGRFTRLLCMHLGSPYTYASLGTVVAPGQFAINDVCRIGRLVRERQESPLS